MDFEDTLTRLDVRNGRRFAFGAEGDGIIRTPIAAGQRIHGEDGGNWVVEQRV